MSFVAYFTLIPLYPYNIFVVSREASRDTQKKKRLDIHL